MNRFIAGALGGLLATVPMTMAMTALWQRLPKKDQYPLPPREITEVTAKKISTEATNLDDKQLAELSMTAHFAYGAATGALYPLLLQGTRSPLRVGASYGVGVWAASYLGWVPAAHILTSATEHPTSRNLMMIGVHIIWGVTTVITGELLRNTRQLTYR